MEHLWAPWRNRYVNGEEKPGEDLFRRLADSSDDAADFILARTKASFAVLNRFPYNLGHLMVCPYREVD
ncbi:MAG: HIT domain-containing protein, partial [Verrucomicrobia bacterium]|nr:HIT domain-containing protein [Verrucomicrobiota bacterium]